ncbi:protein U65 [Elephant endotheliotropic herpesvirus 2]|nr:protein U65 [Elephant endotheliotropic herpesvirus 2]
MSEPSGLYLEHLRQFLNKECIWRKTGKGMKHREYRCLSSASPWTILPHRAARVWSYQINVIIVKKRNSDYMLSLAIDGQHYKQILSPKVSTSLFFVLPFPYTKFYKLTFDHFKYMDDEFTPGYDNSPLQHITIPGLNLYDYCNVLSKPLSAQVAGAIVSIGNCGVWSVATGSQINLVCFALKYDLAVCLSDPKIFPSLARCMASAVGCNQETCSYCTGHDKHVGMFDVCGTHGKNKELCLCSIPCARSDWKINDPSMKPLFCKEDITSIQIRDPPPDPNIIFPKISQYFYGVTVDNRAVELKDDSFMLVRLDAKLSNMMILSCPILKRMCLMV